ncbi:MAG: hypothetical protein IRZ32_14020 [Solirubrobacteraceae bacterium]|nr:hypothetical protein [Solirubrobacteraceae bacterium]
MRRAAIAGATVVLVLGFLLVVRPFVAEQRPTPASIPSPASVTGLDTVPLQKGHPVCFTDVVAEAHAERFSFRVSTPFGPTPELRVTIRGGGYDYTATIPPGLQDGQAAEAAIPAPLRDIPVEVCIRSRGEPLIGLYAANDRARSRSTAVIDGEDTNKSVWFSFEEPRWHAITERVGLTIDRMTVFRPGYVTRGLLWVLAALFVFGVPVAIVWAYVRALREDGPRAAPPLDVNRRRSRWRRFVD